MQFEGVPSLAEFVGISAMQKADHFITMQLLNHKPSGWSWGSSMDCSSRLGERCSMPAGHFTASTSGYISVKQLWPAPAAIREHIWPFGEGTNQESCGLQPPHFADPSKLISPLFDHPASLHKYCCRNYWWPLGRAGTMCGSLPEQYCRGWRASVPSLWDGRAPGKPLLEPSPRCSSFIRS